MNLSMNGLCSSTPRGDGNFAEIGCVLYDVLVRFMQLNPARGRKLMTMSVVWLAINLGLCSSTPRGDGNYLRYRPSYHISTGRRFMQLNPARGRKPVDRLAEVRVHVPGLCSSTPRGDGNW